MEAQVGGKLNLTSKLRKTMFFNFSFFFTNLSWMYTDDFIVIESGPKSLIRAFAGFFSKDNRKSIG
jgi:hypothetical protein